MSPAAQATDRTWSYGGGTALASNPGNWVGGVAPANGDGVIFGNTTPTAPCTWDLALTIASMSVTGSYASTVTLTVDLAVSSSVLLSAGASAMLDLNGRNLSVQGDWTVGGMKTTSTVAGSSVTFYGGGTSNIQRTDGGPARFNYLVINKTAGQIERLLSDIEVFGRLSILTGTHLAGPRTQRLHGGILITDGLFDVTASTLVFAGTQAQSFGFNGSGQASAVAAIFIQDPAPITLLPIEVGVLVDTQPASILILDTTLGVMNIGSMTISGLASTTRIQLLSVSPSTAAGINVTLAPTVRFAFVRDINASAGAAITATNSVDGGNNTSWTFSGGDQRATRFWNWGGGSALASNAGNWTGGGPPGAGDYVVFGSTTPTAPCTWDLAMTVSSWSITNAYAAAVTLAADVIVSSGVLLNAGAAAALDVNGRYLTVQGDWVVGAMNAFSASAGSTVAFSGGGVSKIKRTTGGAVRFNNLIMKKDTDGVDQLLSDIDVAGMFSVLSGTHSAGAQVQYLRQDLMAGSGYMDFSVSTIVFAGAIPQKLALAGNGGSSSVVGAVWVQNQTSVRLLPIPVAVLVATQPASTLIFQTEGGQMSIASMTVSGMSGSTRVQLLAEPIGTAAQLVFALAPTVRFAYVRDLDVSAGAAATAFNSVDGGGNNGWTFSGGGAGNMRIWSHGGGSALASNAANWVGGLQPSAGDYVVFGSTTPTAPCTWDLAVTLTSMSITNGYASTVTMTAGISISSGATLDAGASAKLDLNGLTLSVTGDWIVGDMKTTSTVAGSTVVFTGGGVSKIQRLTAGPARFNNLVINKLAAAGVMETLLSDLDVRGNFTVRSGSHTAGAHTQYFSQNIVLENGFLDLAVSTVVILGSAPQRFYVTGAGDANSIATLYAQTASTYTVPALPLGVLIATQPSTTLIFDSLSDALTITSLTLNGQSAATRQTIKSVTAGQQAKVAISAADVSFTVVQDIDSSAGAAVAAALSLDRGNNLNWTFPIFGMISASSWTEVGATSVTAHWDSSFPAGLSYTAQLSSAPWPNNFAGNQSSTTLNLFAVFGGALSLRPNTSYYLEVSTSASGPFTVLNDSGTLSKPLQGTAVYAVNGTSVTANWQALPLSPPDASSKTAEGYLLQASTSPTYTGVIFSSSTPNAGLSTLTVSGLSGLTTYYLRVGGLNWRGAPNFVAISSVVTPLGLPPGCVVAAEVAKTGYAYTTIASALASFGGSLAVDSCVVIRDTQTYSEQVTVSGLTMNNRRLFFITADPSQPGPAIVDPPVGSTAAFFLANASVTIQNVAIITTNTVAYGVWSSSAYVTLSSVSVDSGGNIWKAGLAITSYTVVSNSSVTVQAADGIVLTGQGASVLASTATRSGAGVFSTVHLNGASWSTLSGGYFFASGAGRVVGLDWAHDNTITLSTMVWGASNGAGALDLTRSSANVISYNYLGSGSGGGMGLVMAFSDSNRVSHTTAAVVDVSDNALYAAWSSSNTFYGMVVSNPTGPGARFILASNFNALSLSTVTSAGVSDPALLITGGSNTVSGCYIQGSTAVHLSGSTGTLISGSVLVATRTAGSALWVADGSSGLSLSTSALAGGPLGAGLFLGPGNSGRLMVSTNTFRPGGRYGVWAATQAAGAQLWITSNTILPSLSAANDVFGIRLDGLATGATIQNNGIYFRSAGSMGAFTAYGLSAVSAAGLVVDHNRFSQPQVLSGGGFEAVSLAGTTNSTFKFNDVLGGGSAALSNAYLLRLHSASTGVAVKNNIFSSSFTVSGTSATISVSADSQAGFSSDYNDFFSSTSLNTGMWGAASYGLLTAWRAASSQDAFSVAVLPRWKDPSAGVEDFHPLSQSGRWNPATASFVADSQTSQTIDKGDPADSNVLESSPNGGRPNQGSYGGTAEASQSYLDLPQGCNAGYNVKQDGSRDYTTIQAAVDAFSPSLGADSCVVIRDTQTYNEQVTVQNLPTNGFRLTILSDPSFISSAPVVNPPMASTAAFLVANDSVTLQHLTVITTNTVAYGVWASSAYVTLSSVSVDSGGRIWTAGVSVSSWSTVSYSSITVQVAAGLMVTGAYNTLAYNSSEANNAAKSALLLNGASSNTVTQSFMTNLSGYGARVDLGSSYNTISLSTMASSALGTLGVLVQFSSYTTITQSYMANPSGMAAALGTGANYNTISQSLMSSNNALYRTLYVSGASNNTITQSQAANPSGEAAALDLGSDFNMISQSTMTGSGTGKAALSILDSASNTVMTSYIQGSTAVYVSGSTGTVVSSSVLVATSTAGSALRVAKGSVGLTLSASLLSAGSQGFAVHLATGNSGVFILSTNTLSGARFGVHVATQNAGSVLWITSNTILPSLSAAHDTYGLYFDGLASGATIQNNGIYYRASGSMGAFTSYGLYAQSAAGLLVDRNRFGQPGMITAGSHEAAAFSGTTNSSFKSNDVHVAGTGLANAFGLSALSGSTGLKVKDNVFLSSTAVSGSSATLRVSADSQAGFASDYNSTFSSNAVSTAWWGTAAYALGAAWTAGSGQDANSLEGQPPYWADPSAGVEDYHPRSPRGRYEPLTGGFVLDFVVARSIDGGDPAESAGLEPSPNGSRLDRGSYGGTAQASKSAPAPTSPILGAVNQSSITIAFGAVASDGYTAQAATDSGFSAAVSSASANPASTQLSPQGLAPNTTYYVRVGALYSSASIFPLGAVVSTPTLAAAPGAAAVSAVYASSISVSWPGNGNPAGTLYQAQLSTDAFVTINDSSRTTLALAAFSNLLPNTTYQARVRAINHAGLPSDFGAAAATATWTDTLQGVALYRVFATSVTVNWVPLPSSPPDASSKTSSGYILQASTAADFSGAQFSSVTPNVALSTLTVTGLSNATYYLRLGALNWNGAANFAFVATTHTRSGLPFGCVIGYNVKQDGSLDHTTLQGALNALPASLTGDACLVVRDTQTYSEQVTVQGFSNNGYRLTIMSDPAFISSGPVINPPAGATAGFRILNDSVTLQNVAVITTNTVSYGVWSSSAYVTLSSVSVDSGGKITTAGIEVSSGSVIAYSSVTVQNAQGLILKDSGSVVYSSTLTSTGNFKAALYLLGASSNTVSRSFLNNPNGYGALILAGADYNTISLSTITVASSLYPIYVSASRYNTFSQDYLGCSGVGVSVFLDNGAHLNTVSFSTISAAATALFLTNSSSNTVIGNLITAGGGYGVSLSGSGYNLISQTRILNSHAIASALSFDPGSSYNTVTQSHISNSLDVAVGSNGSFNLISFSTMSGASASGSGLRFNSGSSNTVSNSYIQGSTAVVVSGTAGVLIGASTLIAVNPLGAALELTGNGSNLTLTSSTLRGGSQGAGAALSAGGGSIVLSTNTFYGSRYGVFAQAQNAGASLWITSNTILPLLSTAYDTYGIYFNGLVTGATVQDNGVYYRSVLAITGVTTYGLYAQGSSGLVIDHNRFNEPGRITAGSYEAISFSATTGSSLLFNDIHATGSNFFNASLLSLRSGSTGVQVKNNVFLSSFSVTGTSSTIAISADSQAGFVSDYNDFFSSGAVNTGTWGALSYSLLAGWRAGTGQDLNSLSAQPLWNDASGGVEDFHPRSQRGRFDPVSAGFVIDGVTSLTIDAADPAAASGLEAAPNGARANQGSFGQTAQASKSAPAALPTLLGVSGSSVTLSWTAVPADGYSAEVSSVSDFSSGILSSTTVSGVVTQLSPQGLSANTTYFLRVGSLYGAVYSYAASVPASTATWAHAPVAAVFAVGTSSHGLSWSRNGNPDGTLYFVEQSTDVFTTLNVSSQTLNAGATFYGLISNKSYSLRVRALGHGGTATAYLTPSSSFTLTADPASTSTAVNLSSAVLTWNAAANDIGTLYNAQLSTDAFATLNLTSATLSQSVTFTALVPNTTYYLRVQSAGSYGVGGFVGGGPAVTLPAVPSAPSISGVWLSSAALSWATGGNSPGTRYQAQVSTDVFATVNTSSQTLLTSATFFGLLSNATYYLRVQAESHTGMLTSFAAAAATATAAGAPVSAPPSAVTASSLQANWLSGGNAPLTTRYEAQLSTDTFATLNESSMTFNASAGFAGLLSNTTYYVRARAWGHDGRLTAFTTLPSTMTLLLPPGLAAGSFLVVEQSSIAVQWTSGGNGPATVYVAQVSTDNFATVNFSSFTLNLSARYGATGAGPALSPNTTYYFQVRATGGGNSSADVALGSTSTLSAVPAGSSVLPHVSSITLAWASAGNGAGTLYQAQLSTDAFATLNASSQTLSLSATFQALVPNTTYYLRARALNHNGLPSSYAAAVSSITLPAAPSPALSAVNLSSMTLDWGSSGDPAGTVYRAQLSTDAFATLNVSSLTLNLSATFQALVPNTTYYLRVRAEGWAGALSPFAAVSALPTLAATPASAFLSAVELSSAALSWDGNGSSEGTLYRAQLSTDAFATLSASSHTLLTSATFFGLLSNATYYLRVQAVSHAGAATAFAVGPATATPPALPVTAAPSNVAAGSFQANWSAAGNAPLTTRYEAQLSTDAFVTLNLTSATFNAAAGFSGLFSNTTYYVRVRALGHDGRVTGFAALPSTTTLLLPPGLAGSSFLAVEIASAAVQWTDGGNNPGTVYAAELSTDAFATLNFSSATLNLSAHFGAGGAGGALVPNTTYYFQVRTVGASNASANVALGSTSTLAAAPVAPAVGPSVSSMSLTWGGAGNGLGTRYQAQLSTDAFATVSLTSQTLSLSATFQALAPNTTFYLRVRAVNHNDLPTAYSAAAAAFTLPATPSSPQLNAISLSSMTLDWSAAGNPAGTVYLAQLSTDAYATLNASSRTLTLSATFQTLALNTTYYLRVQAQGWGGDSPFAAAGAAPTLAAAPLSPAVAAVEASSIALSWGAGGNPAQTPYLAQLSTDAFATVSASSRTLATSATFFSLLSNATYTLRVQAQNAASVATAFVLAPATSTLAVAPLSLAPSAVGPTSITANWSANGNAAQTTYTVQSSTDAFATLNASSDTLSVSAAFSGLSANTTFYFQVRTRGHDGRLSAFVALPSTMTLLLPPGAGAPSVVAVDFASATVRWTSGGNSVGTGYEAELSSDAFTNLFFSSSTLNLSVIFGAGGAGPSLAPNTTYYFRVRARSGANGSAYLPLGTLATPAFAPSATIVVAAASSTVSLDWQPQGDPEPGTDYELWRDVSAAFPTPAKTIVSTSAVTVTGLSPLTTYYFKVRTLGHDGGVTSFDAAVSTKTQPAAPGQPGTPVGVAMSVSSISWTWGSAVDASGYNVFSASDTAAIIGMPAMNAFSHLGLATNTAYGLVAQGFNVSGQGPLSPSATTYTLAAPPAGSVISLVQGTSATISWGLNTNPAGTQAEVQHSTDNAAFAQVFLGAALSYVDTGLLGCTTYYLRVRNRNGDAVATAFNGTVSFTTLGSTPSAPSGLSAFSLAGGRISLSWTASATEGITAYRLYYDAGTGVVAYGAPLAVFTSTETSYTTGVLVSSPTYLFALRAAHRCGVEETSGVFASAAAATTVAAVRASITSPASGKRVAGDRVTVVARLQSGTAAQTKNVLFQYKTSTGTAWVSISTTATNESNPDLAAPWFLHWDVTGLTATSYDLRAVATDVSDSSDTAASVVTITVDPVGWDVRERLVGSVISREQVLNNGAAQAIEGAGAGALVTKIDLPAGSLSGSSTTVTVVNAPVLPASPPLGTDDIGVAMSIELGSGQTLLSGGNSATLTFSYPDVNDDGVIDGTALRAVDLKLHSFDAVAGQWVADLTTTVDQVNRTVSGATRHFSFFAAFPLAGAANLDRVRVYPVPFKPYGANADEGRPFDPGNVNSGIVFDNLPAAVTIKVYTVSGALAAQFSSANSGGRLQWNVRNEDGRELATGGYFAVIASPGQKSVIKRLSIIR